MKKKITIGLAAVAMLLLATAWMVAQTGGPGQTDREGPVMRYLGMGCGDAGAQARLVAELRKDAAGSLAAFRQIVEQGPDPQWLEREGEDARKGYEGAREFRESHRIVHEGYEGAKMAPDAGSYAQERVAAATQRLRLRSLEGIAALGTPEAKKYLQTKARDKAFPMQAIAAELAAGLQ